MVIPVPRNITDPPVGAGFADPPWVYTKMVQPNLP
jgi:hypothetical protein